MGWALVPLAVSLSLFCLSLDDFWPVTVLRCCFIYREHVGGKTQLTKLGATRGVHRRFQQTGLKIGRSKLLTIYCSYECKTMFVYVSAFEILEKLVDD
jgi:hypothetical protein